MEATSIPAPGAEVSAWRRARGYAAEHPAQIFLGLLVTIALILIIWKGLHPVAQRTVNGMVTGSYFALGAIGLTLVYGILKLVNFAQGDMLTLGAYIALLFSVTLELPFLVALVITIVLVAAFGVATELVMWRPMRKRKAGMLQLLLMTIGLAFVIRNMVQIFAGTKPTSLDIDVTTSLTFIDLTIGRTQLIVVITGIFVLSSVAIMLRYTSLGRQMRALADNFDLAETTGIDTGRIVVYTWLLAGGLAGGAGVMVAASIGTFSPNTGFFLLLSLFAAVVLGGIGNAFGALAGGFVIGITQEWSTLVIASEWKVAMSFIVLILVLILRPQGIFGRERTL